MATIIVIPELIKEAVDASGQHRHPRQLVATLVNGDIEAGYHTIQFNIVPLSGDPRTLGAPQFSCPTFKNLELREAPIMLRD